MKKEDQIQLSNNLKALLAENNQSFTQVARKLGINRSTLHNWLYGVTPSPLVALIRLCEYFNLSLDQLCFERSFSEKQTPEITIYLKLDKEGQIQIKQAQL